MDREFYEKMAEGFTAQLKDILSSATYDQIDEFMDDMDELIMNTESDKPSEKLKTLIMSIYEGRIDDIDSDESISLEGLNLSVSESRQSEDDEDGDVESFSMDDFVFSL